MTLDAPQGARCYTKSMRPDFERDGPVAVIRLRRPDARNALNGEALAELTRAAADAMEDARARVVLLCAEGPTFCAGADLRAMVVAGDSPADLDQARAQAQREAQALSRLLEALRAGPKPVIARVQGDAFGGGVGLIAACDLAFSLSHCVFALSEVRLGLIPAVISPYVLPRIGLANAQRLFLTAERFDATQAQAMGLIHETATDDSALDARIRVAVDALCCGGPQALGAAKRLLATLAPISPDIQTWTQELIAQRRLSPEGREGARAFLEKRLPAWRTPDEPAASEAGE